MTIELKPCPFCGGRAELVARGDGVFFVECADESCPVCPHTPIVEYDTTEEAAAAWNTRTPPSDWREARELLDATFQPDSGNLTAAYLVGLADGKATERTCRVESERIIDYGYAVQRTEWTFDLSCGHSVTWDDCPDYCPVCGAKVVDE